jgi:hypothetical protein
MYTIALDGALERWNIRARVSRWKREGRIEKGEEEKKKRTKFKTQCRFEISYNQCK